MTFLQAAAGSAGLWSMPISSQRYRGRRQDAENAKNRWEGTVRKRRAKNRMARKSRRANRR